MQVKNSRLNKSRVVKLFKMPMKFILLFDSYIRTQNGKQKHINPNLSTNTKELYICFFQTFFFFFFLSDKSGSANPLTNATCNNKITKDQWMHVKGC